MDESRGFGSTISRYFGAFGGSTLGDGKRCLLLLLLLLLIQVSKKI